MTGMTDSSDWEVHSIGDAAVIKVTDTRDGLRGGGETDGRMDAPFSVSGRNLMPGEEWDGTASPPPRTCAPFSPSRHFPEHHSNFLSAGEADSSPISMPDLMFEGMETSG